MKHKKLFLISFAVVAIGGAAAVVLFSGSRPSILSSSRPLVDQATLDALPTKNGSQADISRLSSGIIPPTNSWISGMVLQATPLPVYPMPLSFLSKDSGFELGLPTVQSTDTSITGGHVPGMLVALEGATRFHLTRFDKTSATLSYNKGTHSLGNLTLAQGSPYVFYRAVEATQMTISGVDAVKSGATNTYLRYSRGGHDYVVLANKDATITQTGATATVKAPKGSLVTMYGLKSGVKDTLRTFAGNELSSVMVTNKQNANETTTTFEYKTENNQPTAFAPMNYSQLADKKPALTTFDSIYGPMSAVQGSQFTTTVPTLKASNRLDLEGISAERKQQLIASLKRDTANTTITATDSYFAGKQLARAATLLDIAEQLGQTEISDRLKSILRDEFPKRLNAEYFYYDSTIKGIAARTKAFGSEDFNDHHFHYGYFIYAASIFGKYDTSFMQQHKKQVDLLVADIASYEATADFPVQRNYDPYSAHAWAAGLSPFADGNNQESSSEAINAWNGVAQWAELTKNTKLQASGQWMLSNEAATADKAWRHVDTSSPELKQYTSPLTSLNFGGKRTYSTFFSDEANTKLGIQLLPMSPTMTSLASDGADINRQVTASIKDNNFNVALGDYVLMYYALQNPRQATQLLDKQQDAFIDDGNSRTYLEAWAFSLDK